MRTINLKTNKLVIDKNSKEPIIIINDLNKTIDKFLEIDIKNGIKASIVEVFVNGRGEYTLERAITLNENSKLEYSKIQELEENSSLDLKNEIFLKESSKLNMINFELGKCENKNQFYANLKNDNSQLNIFGLVKLYAQGNSSSIFNTIHNGKSCFSKIKYKHSLHDKSKALFEAKTIVNETALFSKVLQNSNTILLSNDASILARPHLEINVDELEASHGATTGGLDEEQLLYLQARSISEQKAYGILLEAFESEIYNSIEDLNIKQFVAKFKKGDCV